MNLDNLTKSHTKEIIDEWFRSIIETYPDEAVKYFLKDSNKFGNPVGYNISVEINIVFEQLIEFEDNDKLLKAIENLMRIRAVQDMQAAQAAGIFTPLKKVMQKILEVDSGKNVQEYIEMCSRIDYATSLAFNSYVAMVRKIYEIKSNEIKNVFGKAVDRVNRKYGFEDNVN
jgi:RsbRD-like negative regulator of sigma factor